MTVLLHTGLEHPSILWLVGIGFLAFVAGLLVNLYRTRQSSSVSTPANPE